MSAIIAAGLLTERLLHRAMRGMVLAKISNQWRNVYAEEQQKRIHKRCDAVDQF